MSFWIRYENFYLHPYKKTVLLLIIFVQVSHNYGYGLMDAEAMVKLARRYSKILFIELMVHVEGWDGVGRYKVQMQFTLF